MFAHGLVYTIPPFRRWADEKCVHGSGGATEENECGCGGGNKRRDKGRDTGQTPVILVTSQEITSKCKKVKKVPEG